MVAICALLEVQVTCEVKSSVDPEDVVPMARNWAVWLGDATVCALGIMVRLTSVEPAPPTPLVPVTVNTAVDVTGPANPFPVAVMVVEPADTAVARPVEVIVATAGELDDQLTDAVTSCVDGLFELPNLPIAENCAVSPTASDCVVGDTEMESSPEGLVQPANSASGPISNNALKETRCNMDVLQISGLARSIYLWQKSQILTSTISPTLS